MSEENQTTNEIETQTIGAYLKQMREKKKLTVKIIAQHTKINSTKLELLEANRFSELPNQAYVVGYVKSYSRTLGLDQQYCLELLDKAYGKNHETIPQQQLQKLSDADKPRVEEGSESPLAKIVAGVAAVAVVIGILAFLSQKEQRSEPSSVIAEDKKSVIDEISPETVEVVSVAPETKLAPPQEVVQAPPAPVEPAPAPAPVAPPPAQKPATEVKPETTQPSFRPIVGPTYSISTISAQEKDLIYPANLRSSGTDGEYHVYIKAVTDDTWITYKTDDEDVRRFVLQKDRHVILRGKVHRIFLGNANATKIFVNQELIDMETRTGVKSLVIPNEVRTRFALPLFVYPDDGRVLTSEEVQAGQRS